MIIQIPYLGKIKYYNPLIIDWLKIVIVTLLFYIINSIVGLFFSGLDKIISVINFNLISIVLMLSGSIIQTLYNLRNSYLENIATITYRLAFCGVAMIAVTVFSPYELSVFINNNIPLIEDLLFIIGFSLFFISVLVISIITIPNINSILFTLASLCFIISYLKIKNEIDYEIDLRGFYELIFLSFKNCLYIIYINIFYQSIITIISTKDSPNKFDLLINYSLVFVIILQILDHYIYKIDSSDFALFFKIYLEPLCLIIIGAISGSIIYKLIFLNIKITIGITLSLFLFMIGVILNLSNDYFFNSNEIHFNPLIPGVFASLVNYFIFILRKWY